jgi:hypothetical protein
MIDFVMWSEITGIPVNPPIEKKMPDFYVLVTFNGNYTATLVTMESNSILVKDATLAQLKAALYVLSLGVMVGDVRGMMAIDKIMVRSDN